MACRSGSRCHVTLGRSFRRDSLMMSSKQGSLFRRRPATLLGCVLLSAMLFACKHNNNNMTKALWVANANNVIEYLPSQLAGGMSAAAPHRTITSAAIGEPQGGTFDA